MKNIKCISAFLLLLGTSFLGGCSNEMVLDELSNKTVLDESAISNDGLIPVNFVMQGYQDFEEVNSGTRSVNEEVQNIQVIKQDVDIPGYKDYEMVTTVKASSINEVQTRASLNTDSHFRLSIFGTDGTLKYSATYKVNGSTVTLVDGSSPSLTAGTYKFVFCTYNINNIAALENYPVRIANDFATYCVTKKITASDNVVPITFVRQMTQIRVRATINGASDNISFSKADVENLYIDGTWKMNADSNDDGLTSLSGSIIISCINNVPYRLLPMSRPLTITLCDLVVNGTNIGNKSVVLNTVLEKGKSYNIAVNFVKRGYYL